MDLPKQSTEGLFCWCWVRGAPAHWGIEGGREVILDLPEVCYPWKVLAAIQAIRSCSPFSSLTGDTGSKNNCQKVFDVIDKPFVPTEAPPLASPNKTAQNLRVSGKNMLGCMWNQATRRKRNCNSHSWFLQTTLQSVEGIPRGTRSFTPHPFPCPRPPFPLPAATAAPLPFATQPSQSWLFQHSPCCSCPGIRKDILFSSFRQLHFEHACWTAGERGVVPSLLPLSHQ